LADKALIAYFAEKSTWSKTIVDKALKCPACDWKGQQVDRTEERLLSYFDGDLALFSTNFYEWFVASLKHRLLHVAPPENKKKFTPRYLKEAKKARGHIRKAERPPLSAMAIELPMMEIAPTPARADHPPGVEIFELPLHPGCYFWYE